MKTKVKYINNYVILLYYIKYYVSLQHETTSNTTKVRSLSEKSKYFT